MQNLMDDLLKLLKKDERLVSQDGVLLKNQTQELARKNDPELIKLLLSDKVIKQHFFFWEFRGHITYFKGKGKDIDVSGMKIRLHPQPDFYPVRGRSSLTGFTLIQKSP